jgi:hypothetical protein
LTRQFSPIRDRIPMMDSRPRERSTMLPSQRMALSTSEARILAPGRKRAWVKIGFRSS